MDDELKKKISDHYFGEYYQKIRAEDTSFSGRLEKFTEKNENGLWGIAGLGIAGMTAYAWAVPAIMSVPMIWVPAAVLTAGIVTVWPAVCSGARAKNERNALEAIKRDIESGVLLERYKTEVLKKDLRPSAELKQLEAAEAAVQFEVAAKKEQEVANTVEAVTQERLDKLKQEKPSKVVLKK